MAALNAAIPRFVRILIQRFAPLSFSTARDSCTVARRSRVMSAAHRHRSARPLPDERSACHDPARSRPDHQAATRQQLPASSVGRCCAGATQSGAGRLRSVAQVPNAWLTRPRRAVVDQGQVPQLSTAGKLRVVTEPEPLTSNCTPGTLAVLSPKLSGSVREQVRNTSAVAGRNSPCRPNVITDGCVGGALIDTPVREPLARSKVAEPEA